MDLGKIQDLAHAVSDLLRPAGGAAHQRPDSRDVVQALRTAEGYEEDIPDICRHRAVDGRSAGVQCGTVMVGERGNDVPPKISYEPREVDTYQHVYLYWMMRARSTASEPAMHIS